MNESLTVEQWFNRHGKVVVDSTHNPGKKTAWIFKEYDGTYSVELLGYRLYLEPWQRIIGRAP